MSGWNGIVRNCWFDLVFFLLFCRDVRTRRLAEKEKNKEEAAIPEKMSFKEKMKMFCENQTPKDKVKISRAQRDIDAH